MTRAQVWLVCCVLPTTALSPGCVVVADDDDEDSVGSASATGDETGGTSMSGGSMGSASGDGDPTSVSTGSTGTSPTTDPTATETSADEASTSEDDSGGDEGGGTIDVTLTGCNVDFGGTVVVSYNGSLGVASVYDRGATLSGSFQFDLDGTGVYPLSSQHRVDTGTVVNMVDVAQGTWTNLDSDALSGGVDTIGGTLTVHAWDPASGIADLDLDGVSLRNVVDGNVCTIDGTIVTTELYP